MTTKRRRQFARCEDGLCAVHPNGYRHTQFCEIYRRWAKRLRPAMRQVHRAGEKTFIDFSGKRPTLVDRRTGELRRVELFVAVLGASSLTYAEATQTQQLPDWVNASLRSDERSTSPESVIQIPGFGDPHHRNTHRAPALRGPTRASERPPAVTARPVVSLVGADQSASRRPRAAVAAGTPGAVFAGDDVDCDQARSHRQVIPRRHRAAGSSAGRVSRRHRRPPG